MSVGRILDQLIDQAIITAARNAKRAATVGDRLLNSVAPVDNRDYRGADWLAEVEAGCEVFEPMGEYPEVPQRVAPLPVPHQVAVDAVCEVLAEHHPRLMSDMHFCECGCGERHYDRQDWREHVAPLIVASLKVSAPGVTSCPPVAADAPSPPPIPLGGGSGHSTT